MSYGTDARRAAAPGSEHAPHAEAVRPIWRTVALLVLGCAALAAAAVVRSGGVKVDVATMLRSKAVSAHSSETAATVTAVDESLTIIVTNEYSNTSSGESTNLKYPFLFNVSTAVLVEPHRGSVLTVSNALEYATYAWSFDGGDVSYGSSITVSPDSTGLLSLLVTETFGGVVNRLTTFTCYVKYVRRELRQLSLEDRERFLDASATLWKISTVEGREVYGDKYVDIHHLAIIHNDLAGNPNCDFIHGATGYAFGNAHAALNGMLEQSLQSIDPRVSLSFWDYTLDYWQTVDRGKGDVHLNSAKNILDLWDSDIFSAKFFGAADNETGVITTGRWAHSTVPVMSDELYVSAGFSGEWVRGGFATCSGQSDVICGHTVLQSFVNITYHMANSFGLLRSPWNMRAENTVVRSNRMCGAANNDQFPTCTAVIQQQHIYESWSDYVLALQFSPHGTVHVFTGGAFGACSEVYTNAVGSIINNATILRAIQMDSSNLQKNYWLSNFKVCPERHSCIGMAQEDCSCTCPDLDQFTPPVSDEDITGSGLWVQLITTVGIQGEYLDHMLALSIEDKINLLTALCETDVLTGEMIGANSPLDITFFATHAEVERMAQRAFLSGNITDMSWPDAATVGLCPGQRAEYKLVWFNYKLDTPLETTELTNVEWRDILNPASPDYATHIPYVYENFEWEHCLNYISEDAIQVDNSLMMSTDWLWLKDDQVTVQAIKAQQNNRAKTNRPKVAVSL